MPKKEKHNGRIGVYIPPDAQSATMVEVFCDTDFLAKSSEFRRFVNDLAMQLYYDEPGDLIAQATTEFKEKIEIGRVTSWK